MLAGDFNLINKKQNDFEIAMTSTSSYKQTIKSLIKAASFQYLTKKQKQHSKVKKHTICKAGNKEVYGESLF